MGKQRSSSSGKLSRTKITKRTIKYLASAPDSNVARAVLEKAPDGAVQAICNAALNVRQGEVRVPPRLKRLFKAHNKHFDLLTDPRVPLAAKRRLLTSRQQGGALPIVVPLLATVIGSVGGEFISRMFSPSSS